MFSLKKVSLSTALLLGVSPILSDFSLANDLTPENKSEILNTEFNTTISSEILTEEAKKRIVIENPLTEEVLSDEFDLERAVANAPSLQKMDNEEKGIFYNIIDEQVELAGITNPDEREIYRNALIKFFDEETSSFNNLKELQIDLEKSIIENIENKETTSSELMAFLENVTVSTIGIKSVHALSNPFKGKIRISVKAAGAVFNTAIGIAVGGGVGAIQAYIIKKGKDEAKRLFTRTIVSRLKAWGAPKLALIVGVCVTTALNYLDIGTNIASQIDKRDSNRNNGYVDIY